MASVIRGSDNFVTEGQVKGSATAWVNWNGTGTVAIRDSFNVSSITDGGTGKYALNFATTMNNTNFAFASSGGSGDHTTHSRTLSFIYSTVGTLSLVAENSAGTDTDEPQCGVVFFGGL